MKNTCLVLFLFAILTGCKAQEIQPTKNDHVLLTGNDSVTSPLNKVLATYFQLTDALAKDNSSDAQAHAKELYDFIDKIPMNSMNAAQHTAWMKYKDKIAYDAEHIKGTNEIEHQREHYVTLSDNMYQVFKSANVTGADMYYQFCPMAADGKGAYWLSSQKKISNPYMGRRMPSCGSTKEVIKGS
jgi:hypothetical protein